MLFILFCFNNNFIKAEFDYSKPMFNVMVIGISFFLLKELYEKYKSSNEDKEYY